MLAARDRHLSCEGCRKLTASNKHPDWVMCKVSRDIRHLSSRTYGSGILFLGYQMCKMGRCPNYKRNRYA